MCHVPGGYQYDVIAGLSPKAMNRFYCIFLLY